MNWATDIEVHSGHSNNCVLIVANTRKMTGLKILGVVGKRQSDVCVLQKRDK